MHASTCVCVCVCVLMHACMCALCSIQWLFAESKNKTVCINCLVRLLLFTERLKPEALGALSTSLTSSDFGTVIITKVLDDPTEKR